MKKRIKSINQDSEVDMTPMLDIVFIMLIFFIVTTTFVKESGITLTRPNKDTPPTDKDVPAIVIIINELEDVEFDSRVIQADAVLANVQSALSINPNVGISVQVAETADTRLLIKVVDQVKQAGLEKVTVSQLPSS
jgi:biopolymer transport protein ExbD